MTPSAAGRVIVEALRLDRESLDDVRRRADAALEIGVGGFVLFGGEAGDVARLTAGLRAAAGRDLLVAADLERGAGQQFRGLTELPPPAALARHPGGLAAAGRAASLTAREALSVGVNWVFAPVLDLDAEADNPIVATRSFGSDPERVAEYGRRWISACQSAGALACAKHFPGHGRTLADSHIELPVVDAPADALEADLRPFEEVAGLAGSMMIAHVAYPALADDRPATLSRPVVTDLLRGRLGFDGLVATDAMIMAGIGSDDAAAAVEVIRAGCDAILYPSDAANTRRELERAAGEDPAFATRLAGAANRADRALRRFPGGDGRAAAGVEPRVDALDFAARTIVARDVDLAGWRHDAPTEVRAISDDPDVGPPAGRDGPLGTLAAAELESRGWNVRSGGAASGPTAQRIVVLAATPRGWKGHGGPSDEAVERIRSELASSERGLLVLLGHARWLDRIGVPGVCAWSTESVMERAAAVWIDRRTREGAA